MLLAKRAVQMIRKSRYPNAARTDPGVAELVDTGTIAALLTTRES